MARNGCALMASVAGGVGRTMSYPLLGFLLAQVYSLGVTLVWRACVLWRMEAHQTLCGHSRHIQPEAMSDHILQTLKPICSQTKRHPSSDSLLSFPLTALLSFPATARPTRATAHGGWDAPLAHLPGGCGATEAEPGRVPTARAAAGGSVS